MYLEDVLLSDRTVVQILLELRQLFAFLHCINLKFHMEICILYYTEVKWHVSKISAQEIRMDPRTLDGLKEIPTQKTESN